MTSALFRHTYLLLLLSFSLNLSAQTKPMEQYIDELMAKMTLGEKAGQISLLSSGWDITGPVIDPNYEKYIRNGQVGSIFNAWTADYTRKLQKMAVENTRLGIPLLFGFDVIHGHRTIFPIPLAEAASWDLDAIENSSRIAAREAAAEGLHWVFAPMIDIARDPRWGRIAEGAGEDVYLTSLVAKAHVRGFQGKDLSATDTVIATAKHFAAYGQSQAGRDYHTTDMSMHELYNTYLPPFKATVDEGIGSFMSSFNELNGVPATGSRFLLTDVLRDQWGFEGFVVTDYTSINEMVAHGFAENDKHAGEIALNAGVDMDMQGSVFIRYLEKSLQQGLITQKQIDTAVRRVLEAKYKLGLFEDPYRYSDNTREKNNVLTKEHLEAARDLARRSFVLLKNTNNTLPLTDEKLNIALVGPLANSKHDMIGTWSAAGDKETQPVTLLEGLQARLGSEVKIRYAQGCSYDLLDEDRSGFKAAIRAAKKSDIIIAAVGEAAAYTGEAASRTSLKLPGMQHQLLKELRKLNKPLVVVVMSGRPNALGWESENADALLHTWHAGTMAGHAISDVLFGDYVPSGKLPVTFPQNVGQVPIYYNMKKTGRPYEPQYQGEKYKSRYLATTNDPLFPFGYGLSYSTFEYSDIALNTTELTPKGKLTTSVTIKNSGNYDAEEVVQLYIRDLVGSITRPVKELKRFKKVAIKKGQSKTIIFTLTAKDLAFHRADMSFGAEKGNFKLFIGTNSQDVQEKDFRLTDSITY